MNIQLFANYYHDCVFAAVLGSGIPEPVLVSLLSHMQMNDSLLVQVKETSCGYEICKVYEQAIGDYESVMMFVTPVRTANDIDHNRYTYLLWLANGIALGLFRLANENGVPIRLEQAKHWGTSWVPWAYHEDGRWKSPGNEFDRIDEFLVKRLSSAVNDYMKEVESD